MFHAFLLWQPSCTLEAMLGELGYVPLEVNLGSIWVLLVPTLLIFGPTGAHLELYLHPLGLHRSHLGASNNHVGTNFCHLGVNSGPLEICWGQLGVYLSQLGTNLVELG